MDDFDPAWLTREAQMRTDAIVRRFPETNADDEFARQLVETMADAGIGEQLDSDEDTDT